MPEINFKHLVSDKHVFVREKVIFAAHVDGIIMNPHTHLIDEAIHDLLSARLKIEDQSFPLDHVGVDIKHNKKGSFFIAVSAHSIHL